MEKIDFSEEYGIEHDFRYGEIMFLLDQHDDHIDPLSDAHCAVTINWNQIKDYAEELLNQCVDLRVVVWHIRAALHLDGISALYHGIKKIDDALASNSYVYPSFPDEPKGSGHAAALSWLSSLQCLSLLKQSCLTPIIRLNVENIYESSTGDNGVSGISFSELIITINNANDYYESKKLPSLNEQLDFVVNALARIENYTNQYSEDYRLDCRNISGYFVKLANQLIKISTVAEECSLEQSDFVDSSDTQVARFSEGGRGDDVIRSRQDAILMLNRVIEYFNVNEPSHPAPIFIRRSQKMIGMDFEKIVEELFPEAMSSVQQYSGNK